MALNRSPASGTLHAAANWWDADRNRLRIIRSLAYGLFIASAAGTIYSGVKGVLPTWALTLYATFAVQLVFLTFMYAIRHSGAEDIRHSKYSLRRERVVQWNLEREMLAEFTRFAFCVSNSINPLTPMITTATHRRLGSRKPVWPAVDSTKEVCLYAKEALTHKLTEIDNAKQSSQRPDERHLSLELDFLAYSAETLINLSREVTAELEDVLQTFPKYDGTVRVRILVRDTTETSDWLIPLALDEERDLEYARDLRTRFKNVRQSALKEFQGSLKDIFQSKNVDFRVRGYITEPLIKGVLVDGERGVFGVYTVDELKDPEGWDYSGHAVTMCNCDIAGDFVQSASALFFKKSFNELWDSPTLSVLID